MVEPCPVFPLAVQYSSLSLRDGEESLATLLKVSYLMLTVILGCTAFEQVALQGHFTSMLAVDIRLCSSV